MFQEKENNPSVNVCITEAGIILEVKAGNIRAIVFKAITALFRVQSQLLCNAKQSYILLTPLK